MFSFRELIIVSSYIYIIICNIRNICIYFMYLVKTCHTKIQHIEVRRSLCNTIYILQQAAFIRNIIIIIMVILSAISPESS